LRRTNWYCYVTSDETHQSSLRTGDARLAPALPAWLRPGATARQWIRPSREVRSLVQRVTPLQERATNGSPSLFLKANQRLTIRRWCSAWEVPNSI